MTRPHDITDLYLAPVALTIDAEIATLERMTHDDLLRYIALILNREPRDIAQRRRLLVEAITHHHEMHGWIATSDPRGLRLSNDEHTLVLGLPANVMSYLQLPESSS